MFGGRRWSSTVQGAQGVTPETPPFRRTASAKFRKKRSLANIHMIKVSTHDCSRFRYSRVINDIIPYYQESFIRGGEHPPGEFRPPSPSSKLKGDFPESVPSTPSHQPQSLVRIKSAASVLPTTYVTEGGSGQQTRTSSALTHETRLTFQNFVQLYQAFR